MVVGQSLAPDHRIADDEEFVFIFIHAPALVYQAFAAGRRQLAARDVKINDAILYL
jgi:hypothetical protein